MHRESRTFPGLTLDRDTPIYQLYEPIGNRESQTSSAILSCDRCIRLGKLEKQVLLLLGRDSDSSVADAESNPIAALDFAWINIHGDRAVIGKLAGVAQQIEQDLSDFSDICVHRAEAFCDMHANRVAVFSCRRLQRGGHFLDQRRHVEVL